MKRGWEGQRECGQTQTGCVSPGFQEMERLDVQENVEKIERGCGNHQTMHICERKMGEKNMSRTF